MTPANHKTVSAADIVFPDDPLPKPPVTQAVSKQRVDMEAVMHDTYLLLCAHADRNKNEQLIMALKALIAAGVNLKPKLVLAATHLGFSRGHAAAVIGKSQGDDPRRHLWGQHGGVLVLHGAVHARQPD